MKQKKEFAFARMNFILLGIGMAAVILGFILMSGAGSDMEHFNAEIFSARRVKVAPAICLAGYLFIVYAILHRPKDCQTNTDENQPEQKS